MIKIRKQHLEITYLTNHIKFEGKYLVFYDEFNHKHTLDPQDIYEITSIQAEA